MKRDQGMELERARELADSLVEILKPVCELGHCQVAGSIRRLKPEPNDIEIVVRPLFVHTRELTMFDSGPPATSANLVDTKCGVLLAHGILEKRPDKNGRFCWGERIKRATYFHQEEGWGDTYAPLDLFSCIEPAQWGVIYAIRTGPGDFNRLLVTSQRYGGACPLNRKVAGGEVWDMHYCSPEEQAALAAMAATKFAKLARQQQVHALPIETPTEEDFFGVLHIPHWPPEERTLVRLRRFLQQK